ncbi:MAG: hypothetical protein EPO23_01710 [Xanthobacteraceae bacterium]|nr:MAG: hypothetical protein EPO23_01710 [Xanthobacteraceae bacterium]
MATKLTLPTHKSWEDWCSIGVGVLIMLSPVFATTLTQTTEGAMYVAVAISIGVLVVLAGYLELVILETWEEWVELTLGALLVASPWLFGYSQHGTATMLHVVLGIAVMALAVLELRQDTGHPTHT